MFVAFAFIFLKANRAPLGAILGGISAILAVAAGIACVRALLLRIDWDSSGVRRVVGPRVANVPWKAAIKITLSKDGRSVVLWGEGSAVAVPSALVGFGQFAAVVLASVPNEMIEPRAREFLSEAAADVRQVKGDHREK